MTNGPLLVVVKRRTVWDANLTIIIIDCVRNSALVSRRALLSELILDFCERSITATTMPRWQEQARVIIEHSLYHTPLIVCPSCSTGVCGQ